MAPFPQPALFNPQAAQEARAFNASMTKGSPKHAPRTRSRVTSSTFSRTAPSSSSSAGSIRASGLVCAGAFEESKLSSPSLNYTTTARPSLTLTSSSPPIKTRSSAAHRIITHGVTQPPPPTGPGFTPPHKLAAAKKNEADNLAKQAEDRQAEDKKRADMAIGGMMSGAARMLAFAREQEQKKALSGDSATQAAEEARRAVADAERARQTKIAAEQKAAADAASEKARKAKLAADKKAADVAAAAEEARKAKLAAEQKATADAEIARKARVAAEQKAQEEAKVKALRQAETMRAAEQQTIKPFTAIGAEDAVARVRAKKAEMAAKADMSLAAKADEDRMKREVAAADKIKRERDDTSMSVRAGIKPNTFEIAKEGQHVANATINSIQRLDTSAAEVTAVANNVLAVTPNRARPDTTGIPSETELLDSLANLLKDQKMLEEAATMIKRKLASVNEHISVKHEQVSEWKKAKGLMARLPEN